MSRAMSNELERYRAEVEGLLEAGRNEEILINHLDQDPQLLCRKLSPLLPVTDIRNPFDFSSAEETDIESLRIPDGALVEKITVENQTLSFIASTLKLATLGLAEGEKFLSQDFCRSERLRLEEPLMRDGFVLPKPKNDIKDFEPLQVSEENDEGLKWSTQVRSDVREFEKKLRAEKLDMPAEVRNLLKKCCDKPKQLEFDDVLHSEYTSIRRPILEPLSPPLVVLPAQGIQELPALDWVSLGVQPLLAETNAEFVNSLTKEMMDEDSLLRTPHSPSPSRFVEKSPIHSSPLKTPPSLEALKLEVPLTPPHTVGRTCLASNFETDIQPLPPPSQEDSASQTQLKDLVHADVQQLQRELAQEQLQEADTTMRIEVPVMDFSIPKLPWAISRDDMENMRYLDGWAGLAKKKWRGIKIIEIDMVWAPFTRKNAAVPRENIEDTEGSIQHLLVTTEDCASAEQELLDSLVELNLGDDTVEVLDYAVLEKNQMAEVESMAPPERKRKPPVDYSFQDLLKKKKKHRPAVAATRDAQPADTITFDGFSAASALDAFMRSRGVTPAPLVDTSRAQMPPPPRPVKMAPRPEAMTPLIPAPPQSTQLSHPAAPIPPANLPPADFIVSTTLLSERNIFKSIKSLYPAARFIERDFLAVIGDVHTLGQSRGRMVVTDADMILSPTRGLILTTLRRLSISSPLPGGNPPIEYGRDIKTRIIEVSKRYEHLQLLIRVPAKTQSANEAKGLSKFVEFAVSLEAVCRVEHRLVGDSDEEAVRWIIAAMKSHGHRLFEEESGWEVFLRKVGFNAMAAQVLLQTCRPLGGIQAFLDMGYDERRARFAGLVGERVLARVKDRLMVQEQFVDT